MNKTAIVTGASRGIGRAIALRLARDGFDLAVCCKESRELANEVCTAARQYGVNSESFVFDVSNANECNRAVFEISEKLSEPYVLINNAGIALYKMVEDTTDSELQRVMGVNFGGTFNMTRAVLPFMVRGKAGKIVNISSMWGVTGGSCEAVYSASKGAVIAFTKAVAKEVGLSGINVNCVSPGVIKTDMTANLSDSDLKTLSDDTPLGRTGLPEDVSAVVSFLVSDDARFVTGQVINADGGMII